MRLSDKVALVTGGNSGIGRATAELFANEGARVVIAARDTERGQDTVQAIEAAGGAAQFVTCDVRLEEDCEQAVQAAVEGFGGLDVLVNSAGTIVRGRDVMTTTLDEWEATFAVNVRGAFLTSKHALPVMIAAGGGSIVHVASYFGLVGSKGVAAYCASKGALVQLTRAMALDHAADGVRVNCVCPGSVYTPMIEAAWENYDGEDAPGVWAAKHPVGRIARPEEVAEAILYLATPASSFVTGVALPVDGGITAA
jgi:NAD(P)-dependent dehydrogenase (short-subunit alcohol dehydrogenase family)